MLPGEEVARVTSDGKPYAFLTALANMLTRCGFHTLSIGKPGIEFFQGFNGDFYYDKDLYASHTWSDLVANVGYAVEYLRADPAVDGDRIYLLGHSEGTQVAVDFTAMRKQATNSPAGLFLLGYAGVGIERALSWQLFERPVTEFLAPDVDANRDGILSEDEIAAWPAATIENPMLEGFSWALLQRSRLPATSAVSLTDALATLHASPELLGRLDRARRTPVWAQGVFQREGILEATAALSIPLWVFTGDLDMNTPAALTRALAERCEQRGKRDCHVTVMPGLGHGMSKPRGPRAQRLVDMTFGPVDPSFAGAFSRAACSVAANATRRDAP